LAHGIQADGSSQLTQFVKKVGRVIPDERHSV